MLKQRSQIDLKDCWDTIPLYPSLDEWSENLKGVVQSEMRPYWPKLGEFKGRLGESTKEVKKLFDLQFEIDRKLSSLYTWAHLKHDEDITNETYKKAQNEVIFLLHAFIEETSWIEPELLALPESKLNDYLTDSSLQKYRFTLEKILHAKAHTLTQEGERILSLSHQPLSTSYKAFNALSDADFCFGKVEDAKGETHELTHGSYGVLLRSQDRTLRKNAFEKLHGKYADYQNTITELLNGTVQGNLFQARARKYKTCLEAALYPRNIDVKVYHQLIETVNKHLPSVHRYISLRKKVLNLDAFHLYDSYVPLVKDQETEISHKNAINLVIESVKPLGSNYQEVLKKGIEEQRWVDWFENKNKRSGAYSSGCYDSHPYILMNYKNTIKDLFTLAHEAGHSMHSYLSHQSQPYHTADYPIFLAEIASTFNEELLFRMMLNQSQNSKEQIYLLNQKIDDIRATLFRQTMFAEFELKIHTLAEQGIPLTPEKLKEEYLLLNQKYFGKDAIFDCNADMEWGRIPHFYHSFYVYQYATGLSAAMTFAERVVEGSPSNKEAYLTLLSSGGSDFPLKLLEKAGLDMKTPVAVETTCQLFDKLVTQLEQKLANK